MDEPRTVNFKILRFSVSLPVKKDDTGAGPCTGQFYIRAKVKGQEVRENGFASSFIEAVETALHLVLDSFYPILEEICFSGHQVLSNSFSVVVSYGNHSQRITIYFDGSLEEGIFDSFAQIFNRIISESSVSSSV